MKLSYRETGEGKPLIILHGLFGSSDNWLSIANELESEYKVYLIDQRNHGSSPHDDDFTYEAMAADLADFLKEHNIKDPIVMGHSMGGKTAMQFALSYPDLLRKLIVVDIAPRYYPPHHQTILEGLQSIDIGNLKSRRDADKALAKYVHELGVRQFLLKNLSRNSEGGYEWKMNLPVISEKIENVGQAIEENTSFDKPVLFINGATSGYLKESDEEMIYKLFPQATIQAIQGAGHWVHAEKPKEFTEVVRAFVRA